MNVHNNSDGSTWLIESADALDGLIFAGFVPFKDIEAAFRRTVPELTKNKQMTRCFENGDSRVLQSLWITVN